MSHPILSLREISIAFGPEPLFKELNLHIYDRDRICLVGRNGDGKSTLMEIIAGIRDVDKGIYWTSPELRIGYLPQQTVHKPDATVQEYVMEGLEPEKRHEA